MENIFTSKASSAVLTQDLLDIQRLESELGMEVEAVDDNIFHWKVRPNRCCVGPSQMGGGCGASVVASSRAAARSVRCPVTTMIKIFPIL